MRLVVEPQFSLLNSARNAAIWNSMRRVLTIATFGYFVTTVSLIFAQTPSRVAVHPVVRRDIRAGKSFVGTVLPRRTSNIGSSVEGRVVELLIDDGQAVKAGQPLAKLDTKTLEIQQAGAQAELSIREQELAELENGSRDEERASAEARMLGAKALNEYAQNRFKRLETLFARNVTSEDDLQDASSVAEQARQRYVAAQNDLKLLDAGTRTERIEQARAKVLAQQEAINLLKDQIERHTILAPFGGYVVQTFTEIGQWIDKGGQVATIVELDSVEVEILVLESYMSALDVGTHARVQLNAVQDRQFEGPVATIVPQADLRSRSFPVRVRLQNEATPTGLMLMKPGMFARVMLPVGDLETGLVVPKDSLVLGGAQPAVFVVQQNVSPRTVRRVPVELGVLVGGQVQVSGDLSEGDLVVVEGNERLRSDQQVAVISNVDAGE